MAHPDPERSGAAQVRGDRLLELRVAHEVRRLLVGVAGPAERLLAAQRTDELQPLGSVSVGARFMSQVAVYCSRDHWNSPGVSSYIMSSVTRCGNVPWAGQASMSMSAKTRASRPRSSSRRMQASA